MDLNWRRPSRFGRLVHSGLMLSVIGLVMMLLDSDKSSGFGWMLGGLIVMVVAFVLHHLRGKYWGHSGSVEAVVTVYSGLMLSVIGLVMLLFVSGTSTGLELILVGLIVMVVGLTAVLVAFVVSRLRARNTQDGSR